MAIKMHTCLFSHLSFLPHKVSDVHEKYSLSQSLIDCNKTDKIIAQKYLYLMNTKVIFVIQGQRVIPNI